MSINISFLTTVIFIVFVIIIFIYIASIGYNSENDTKNIDTKNSDEIEPILELQNTKNKIINTINVETKVINNTHNFNIKEVNELNAFLIIGTFENSCISLYTQGKHFYTQNLNGVYNVLLLSNSNLIQSITKINKNKSIIIPLELYSSYEVYLNNISNYSIQNYNIEYLFAYKPLPLKNSSIVPFTEFDLNLYAQKNILNIHERVVFKNTEKENMFKFFDTGKFALVYITNKHNYDLNINNKNIQVRKNDNEIPQIEIVYITNPNITIENIDYINNKKSVHDEYVEFITVPNTLLNKFLYGSEPTNKKFSNRINDKILLFSLL